MESWGRKKRNIRAEERNDEDMTLSQEILVLDFGDDDAKLRQAQTAAEPAKPQTVAVSPDNYRNNSKFSMSTKYAEFHF